MATVPFSVCKEFCGTGGGGGGGSVTVDQEYNPESKNAQSGIAVAQAIANSLGDTETALDYIIEEQNIIIRIQNSLIGGDTV